LQGFRKAFPIACTVFLVLIVVLGWGALSAIFIPVAILLLPYYAANKRMDERPRGSWEVIYWATTAAMTIVMVELVTLFYGHPLIVW